MSKQKQGRWMDLADFLEGRDLAGQDLATYDAEELADEGLTVVDAEDVFKEV